MVTYGGGREMRGVRIEVELPRQRSMVGNGVVGDQGCLFWAIAVVAKDLCNEVIIGFGEIG